MSYECFVPRKFRPAAQAVIHQVNTIIGEYAEQGFTLTVRQVHYQRVSRGLVENTAKAYNHLKGLLSAARLAGLVDWDAIEDRTRSVRNHTWWSSPASLIEAAADQYRENVWAGQRYRPQVWVEKDALVGVIEPACTRWRVPYFPHRGNNSQTLQYQSGKQFAQQLSQGLIPVVLHLADHDPNGLDMTRDNRDRLAMFAGQGVQVQRLALNRDQIDRYNPPVNFAKESDSRFAAYSAEHGQHSWELDALSPTIIDTLINDAIAALVDNATWQQAEDDERARKAMMAKVADRWSEIEQLVQ